MQQKHKERQYSVGVLEKHQEKHKRSQQVVNICPECHNRVFFLEAGFLCPTCGYSMETVYS